MENLENELTYTDITGENIVILLILLKILESTTIEKMFLRTDIPNVAIELRKGNKDTFYGYLMKNIGDETEEDWRVYSSIKETKKLEPAFTDLEIGTTYLSVMIWLQSLDIKEIGFPGTIRRIDKENTKRKHLKEVVSE